MPRRALIPSWLPLATIALALASRFLPHPWNLTPVGAMFLFCGFSAVRPLGLTLPLAAYILSDLLLDGFVYHVHLDAGAGLVWFGFALVWCVGWMLRRARRFVAVYPAAMLASVAFFAVSNFGVWLSGTLYPHTALGLMTAYIAGIPFLQATLFGDVAYATIFFATAVALQYFHGRLRRSQPVSA